MNRQLGITECNYPNKLFQDGLLCNPVKGYEIQVEEYAKAEQTDNMIYVLVYVGNSGRMKKFSDRYNRDIDEGKKVPEAIMIDETSKESASIT